MKYNLSFQERAKLAMMQISTQPSVTLEQAKKQAFWIKTTSVSKAKKQRDCGNMLKTGIYEKNINDKYYAGDCGYIYRSATALF